MISSTTTLSSATSAITCIVTFLLLLITTHQVESYLNEEPLKCQSTDSFLCNIDNYKTVLPFSNSLGHTDLNKAKSELHSYAFVFESCREKIQLFLCSLYFPVCAPGPEDRIVKLSPCKEICVEALQCQPFLDKVPNMSWPIKWSCDNFLSHEDDKLCVINNNHQDNQSFATRSPGVNMVDVPESMVTEQPSRTLNSTTEIGSCEPGWFDCQSNDPKKPFCIMQQYVCDGRKDCLTQDGDETNEGIDEQDCKNKCEDGQLYCDDKCISRYDICNGKVDCSSGIDEIDCYDNLTGLIQSILCISVMFLAVYIFIRFYNVDSGQHKEITCDRVEQNDDVSPIGEILSIQQQQQQFEPMYQEPSIMTKSDYERVNAGGYSGASSVYEAYNFYLLNDTKEPSMPSHTLPMPPPTRPAPPHTPPAPPPTPAPSRGIYSTGSMKLNFYVNTKD